MCSLPRILSQCLQDGMLFFFYFNFFFLRANLGAGTGERCQSPLLNTLLDHLGPKVLRQNRGPCPQISLSLGVGMSFRNKLGAW